MALGRILAGLQYDIECGAKPPLGRVRSGVHLKRARRRRIRFVIRKIEKIAHFGADFLYFFAFDMRPLLGGLPLNPVAT